jgi:hypothetical protein
MKFPAKFTPTEDGGADITFRDFPIINVHAGPSEIGTKALQTLARLVKGYITDLLPVPTPSDIQEGETYVMLHPEIADRVAQHNARLHNNAAIGMPAAGSFTITAGAEPGVIGSDILHNTTKTEIPHAINPQTLRMAALQAAAQSGAAGNPYGGSAPAGAVLDRAEIYLAWLKK